MVFLGASRTKPAATAHECGWWMRSPMLAMAGACLTIGVAPVLCLGMVARAAAEWCPAWPAGREASPLAELAPVQQGLVLALAAAGWLLWRKARANGLRRGPTWDCGYASPGAKMQYSGGSFSGIAAGWFGWLLRPVRRLRRPRGPFPTQALLLERLPDTLLERVVVPAGGVVMRVSLVVRRLQHGRLQSYVLYVLAGTLAVGIYVMFASLT
jgi:hydrogenase-4 component B